MVTQPHNILSFRAAISAYHKKDQLDENNTFDDIMSVYQLLQRALEMCQSRHYNLDSLCREVSRLTSGQACLVLQAQSASSALPPTTQISLPVRFAERTYGTLCILDDGAASPTFLSFSLAQLLAQTCAYLLYTLEQTAFLQEQCQQVAYQLNGPLTKRELEVLALMCRGYSSKAIANRLCISITTVGKHRQHIYEQLGVHNERDACLVAYKAGLYTPFLSQGQP